MIKGVALIKQRQTLFASPDKKLRICVAVSKRYDRPQQPYWYAFHPGWHDFLSEGQESYFVLACMDHEEAYAVPLSAWANVLDDLWTTERPNGKNYWHVVLVSVGDGNLAIKMPKTGKTNSVKA